MSKLSFSAPLLLLIAMIAYPSTAHSATSSWVGSWEACPAPASLVNWSGAASPPTVYQNQTVREVVHLTAGGSQVRVRLTNRYGASDLIIGAATVAGRTQGSSVAPGRFNRCYSAGKLRSPFRPARILTATQSILMPRRRPILP